MSVTIIHVSRNRQRGLHDFGGHSSGELVLIETQALCEHVAVKDPAQPHREVAGERLLFDQGLHGDKQDAGEQDPASMNRWSRCLSHSCAGGIFASQSTTRPRTLNNHASKAPMLAVRSIIALM